MSIVTIAGTDKVRVSLATINDNFTFLANGRVAGADALLTVGAIPYVTAAGQLGQDSLYWDASNDRVGIGTASWDGADQKLKVAGSGAVTVGINAAAGDNPAELTLWSGGSGGSGDHGVIGFRSGSTAVWYLAGIWNGGKDFGLIAQDAGFVFRTKIYNSTGNAAFGSSVGADNGYRVSAHQAGASGYAKFGTFTLDATGQIIGALATPASAAAAGVQGTIVWDANFIYVCVATNTWKRAALSTW